MIPTRSLRRPRVVIVGCGDVASRMIPLLSRPFKLFALNRQAPGADRTRHLRDAGVVSVSGDLDDRNTLRRIGALAASAAGVFHFAPPPSVSNTDLRTRAFIAAVAAHRAGARSMTRSTTRLASSRAIAASSMKFANIVTDTGPRQRPLRAHGRRILPARSLLPGQRPQPGQRGALRIVYASTTGVYGDCAGALIDETRAVNPANARAIRRVSAERQLRAAGAGGAWRPVILRIPGIYAGNRLPDARLRKGTPALRVEDDVFTSHIHADDLAAIAVRAWRKGRPQRLYHASDDSRMKMGDYFERVADALGLPYPRRISREQAERELEPVMLSFMRESRRLDNGRLVIELGYRLRYPSVDAFLSEWTGR